MEIKLTAVFRKFPQGLAIALASRGHVDQAIAELRQILQTAPDYAPARDALQQIDSRKAQ
jgi:hypothetical protein